MRMFGRYLRQVLSTGWGILFVLAGAVSTGVTFVLIYKPKFALSYWIPGAISIAAWLIAPYRLYRQQQTQIETLTENQQRPRHAQLKVIEERAATIFAALRHRIRRQSAKWASIWSCRRQSRTKANAPQRSPATVCVLRDWASSSMFVLHRRAGFGD